MANEGLITLNALLTTFRSSGVYTIYRDNSKSPQVQANEPIRVVVGFSKYGVFNAPIYIEKGDKETALRLYGARDKALERKGSFFHAALDICLDDGPVIALNLLKLNNEVDQNGVPTANADVAEYRSFSLDVATANGTQKSKLLSSYYNKERFWKADKDYLLATRAVGDQKSLLNFTNLSQGKLSFIIRKNSDIRGFDVTARDWYADDTLIPKFIKPTDLISDYLIDVIVINGDYGASKYPQLSLDPVLGNYFDGSGLKINKTADFLNLTQVSIRRVFSGFLIPGFRDKNGQNLDIETAVNREVTATGVLCAVDKKELDNYETDTNVKYIDMVGHRLLTNNVGLADFMSYKRKLTQDFLYNQKLTNAVKLTNASVGVTITSGIGKITVQVTNANPEFADLNTYLKLGTIFQGLTTAAGLAAGITITNPALFVTSVLKTTSIITFDVSNSYKTLENGVSGSLVNLVIGAPIVEVLATGTITVTNAGVTGNVITAISDIGPSNVTLGAYTVQLGDTPTLVAAGTVSAINALTGSHGYTASNLGAVITVTAPIGSGALANAFLLQTTLTGSLATTNAGLSGGVRGTGGDLTYEIENDRLVIDGTSSFYIADIGSTLYTDYKSGQLTDGDKITDNTNTYYVKFELIKAQGGVLVPNDMRDLVKVSLFVDSDLTIPAAPASAIPFAASYDSAGFPVSGAGQINFISLVGSINLRVPATVISSKVVRIPISQINNVKIGQYLVGEDADANPIMARVLSVKKVGTINPTDLDVECDNIIKTFVSVTNQIQVERYIPLEEMFTNYDITALSGFTLKPSHMPNDTNARVKEIYAVLTESNLAEAMADPEMINFRYLIDTFHHGLEPNTKSYLSNFCRKRQKCLGLLNSPTVQQFKDSQDPRFTESPTPSDPLPILNIEYINKGGNLQENPSFLFTMPEEEQGASFVGFFFPEIEAREDSGDFVLLPPAPFVSNNFVRKFKANPFAAVAGNSRGVITGNINFGVSGTSYDLTKTQRGALEEKGINPIYTKQDGRVVIAGNETSYQKFNSILNNLNARDTLITLEIDSEKILENFLFEFNNDILRTTVESSLSAYYAGIRDGFQGIVSFKIIFDRKNNPFWVTSNGAAIVDVELELPEVAKKFINRVTLTRGNNPVVGSFVAV